MYDAANRYRLPAVTAAFDPDEILLIDAEERINALDAKSLRKSTLSDEPPVLAYGVRCYPTSDDGLWYLPAPIWLDDCLTMNEGNGSSIRRGIPPRFRRRFRVMPACAQRFGSLIWADSTTLAVRRGMRKPGSVRLILLKCSTGPVEDDSRCPYVASGLWKPPYLGKNLGARQTAKSQTRAMIVLSDNARGGSCCFRARKGGVVCTGQDLTSLRRVSGCSATWGHRFTPHQPVKMDAECAHGRAANCFLVCGPLAGGVE